MFRHIVLAILLTVSVQGSAQQGPLVAAASSLRSLWPALVNSYITATGEPAPRVSFASSGLLATQITNGAPFEIFLSADRADIERLPQQLLSKPYQRYALGELQLVVPENSPIAESLSLETLAAQLTTGTAPDSERRLAIPNPRHAPYGRAAREALESAGIWPLPQPQLLAAENAAQTLQFVRTGAVMAAIVPQALVHAHGEGITAVRLPEGSYTPVEHTLAVLRTASPSAQRFATWILESEAAAILQNSGLRADYPSASR